MIHWINPICTLILWIVYLGAGIGCIYFFWPAWGGWNTLDTRGKCWAVYCVFMCLVTMALLVYTTPYPIVC